MIEKSPQPERKMTTLDLNTILNSSDLNSYDLKNLELKLSEISKPVDIGSRTFEKRSRYTRSTRSQFQNRYIVDESTFSPYRNRILLSLLEYAAELNSNSKRPATIKAVFRGFISFIDWYDNQNVVQKLKNDQALLQAYIDYSNHLQHRCDTLQINSRTASSYQNPVTGFLKSFFSIEFLSLLGRVPRIMQDGTRKKITKPPQRDHAANYLLTLSELQELFFDFIINHTKYPFQATINKKKYSFFPAKKYFCFPASYGIGKKHGNYISYTAYNFEKGRLSEVTEINKIVSKQCKTPSVTAEARLANARRIINEANNDPLNLARVKIINQYMLGHAMMFIAATGMNLAQLIDLRMNQFEEDHQSGKITFRCIKPRANNAIVEFKISKKFGRCFKKYLMIRNLMVDITNENCSDRVFFIIRKKTPRMISEQFTLNFHKNFLMFLDNKQAISPRQWRVFKGRHYINKLGPIAAAKALQNSPETIVKSYSAQNDDTAARELTSFFERYRTSILTTKDEETIKTGVGRCLEPGEPTNIEAKELIKADCRYEEGCLFCRKFRVIPDEEDIYKLQSYKAVLIATQHKEGFENTSQYKYSKITKRIDQIVSTIIETGLVTQEQVNKIRIDAEEKDDLYPYWQQKLELLIQLGVIH